MDTIRKLPAAAGAEWLLGGFALLRQAPLALGALGALWGILASLVATLGLAVPALSVGLQFLVGLLIQHEAMPPSRWLGFILVWVALSVLTWDALRTARKIRTGGPAAVTA